MSLQLSQVSSALVLRGGCLGRVGFDIVRVMRASFDGGDLVREWKEKKKKIEAKRKKMESKGSN